MTPEIPWALVNWHKLETESPPASTHLLHFTSMRPFLSVLQLMMILQWMRTAAECVAVMARCMGMNREYVQQQDCRYSVCCTVCEMYLLAAQCGGATASALCMLP